MGKNGQFNRQREEIMKKLAVLTSFVFLFGVGSAAVADTVNYNDIVQAGGAAANDGGEAVAVSNNLNENQLGSNNSYTSSKSFTLNASSTETEVEDSYNTDNSKDSSTNTFGVSKAAFGSASNVGSGSANVASEFHAKGEVVNTSTSSNASKTNADNYNKQEVEAEGKGNAATMTGDAFADSRDQSSHTYVEADAEEGSLAAINTAGDITLDKSTTISISNIGLALQKNELEGKVEHNVLIVGGPEAVSVTKSGETESGETESGEAKSGATLSGAKSKSGSAAFAGASGDGATADANSGSESRATSDATGGSATSGSATGGSATGGFAQGAAASATTTFTTGANDFSTGSFNGIATFNVNSGVNSLQQSPISINAVVGGGVSAVSPLE
ncbi:MAG: hypothetical protein A2X90_06800 [Deltaproteobacteria bacterium GWA2_65_63]|nr:MAG: hypothetical protein A2X90_06800 [Deltaproteobacteria bacterium GWA2_65_63]HAM31953.1 hypothetical protein [Deltaproteobacteria bacterium]